MDDAPSDSFKPAAGVEDRPARPLPDPTRAQARALIVGTGSFWFFWGVAVVAGGLGVVAVALLSGIVAFLAGGWLYFWSVFPVVARAVGASLREWRVAPPWRTRSKMRERRGSGWWRVLMPAYYKQASRVLGWNESAVIRTLGFLLAVDLCLFLVLIVVAPPAGR